MSWLQDIVSNFALQGLPVKGLAYFRDVDSKRMVTFSSQDGELELLSLNEKYRGYLRAVNAATFTEQEEIDCKSKIFEAQQDIAAVFWLERNVGVNGVIEVTAQAFSGYDVLSVSSDKGQIMQDESVPENDYTLLKIVYRVKYRYVGSSCPQDVCAVYYDPCFEVPSRPTPQGEGVYTEGCILGDGTQDNPIRIDDECLPSDECTLEVGGGCCDYSVEGIELRTGVCITIPEVINVEDWGDTIVFSIGFQFGDEAQTTWFVNFEEPFEQITSAEIIAALELAYGVDQEAIFTYDVNGNTICIYPTPENVGICFVAEAGFLNIGGTASTAVTDVNLCSDFIISGQFEETETLCANAIENTCVANDHAHNGLFLGLLSFEVNINDTWTDVTDEVSNGTWSRTNVCDDVITQWRIIDSEENVIDSGEVTATCDGSTEVTDSVCDWLQEHQTAIEQLQNNPQGLTCETLADCEVITDIQEELGNKANTADLATVATSGSYNDLTDLPTIPAAQIQSDWNQANNAAVDFIKNKPTNVSAFTNDANYITLAQARAGGYIKFFADFGNTSVNTNTSNNVIGSVLIPANTITGNAILETESAISRSVSGANPGHRLFINTTNSYTGATQIAALGISTTSLWVKGERSYKCAVGSMRGFSFTTPAPIDDTANTSAPSATAIDWTVDQYILTVVNNATGETTTHEYTTVKVLTI